jgi:hypothetical protein
MTMLAYIIVIVISQFVLTAGVILTGLILDIVLAPIPERLRMPALGFIGGVAAAVLTVQVAQLLFGWLVGPGSFGWGPFLAAVVPLAMPMWNDYDKYRQLRKVQSDAPPRVAEFAAPSTAAMGAMPLGALVGIVLGAFLLM